jgi:hypothetical protein
MRVSALLRFEKRSDSLPLDTPSRAGARILLTTASLFCRDQRGIGSAALQGCPWSPSDLHSSRAHRRAGFNCHCLAILQSRQSWQYNKFTLWLTCGAHPYPLPIHPRLSQIGVTSSQELPGKSSQPDGFQSCSRFYYLINRAMLHPSAFLGENKVRRRTLNQLLPRLFVFAAHLPLAASCAHLDERLVQ